MSSCPCTCNNHIILAPCPQAIVLPPGLLPSRRFLSGVLPCSPHSRSTTMTTPITAASYLLLVRRLPLSCHTFTDSGMALSPSPPPYHRKSFVALTTYTHNHSHRGLLSDASPLEDPRIPWWRSSSTAGSPPPQGGCHHHAPGPGHMRRHTPSSKGRRVVVA